MSTAIPTHSLAKISMMRIIKSTLAGGLFVALIGTVVLAPGLLAFGRL